MTKFETKQAAIVESHVNAGNDVSAARIHTTQRSPSSKTLINNLSTERVLLMKKYVVLYRIESIMTPLDAPFGFVCDADDSDHAEEQCVNAYPDCDIVWVVVGDNYADALDVYWNVG